MNIGDYIKQQSETGKNYTCKDCGREFDTDTGLKVHRAEKHSFDPKSHIMY